MHFNFLAKLFLAIYLVLVGLVGVGVHLPAVTPVVAGVFALVAGVLIFIKVVKCWGHCDSCDYDVKK